MNVNKEGRLQTDTQAGTNSRPRCGPDRKEPDAFAKQLGARVGEWETAAAPRVEGQRLDSWVPESVLGAIIDSEGRDRNEKAGAVRFSRWTGILPM